MISSINKWLLINWTLVWVLYLTLVFYRHTDLVELVCNQETGHVGGMSCVPQAPSYLSRS